MTMGAVIRRQEGVCRCGAPIAAPPVGYHHVFSKARWPELIDVAANIIGVCADCHANHESAAKRLPRDAIAVAEELASTPPMQAYLDRVYGPRKDRGFL